MDQPIFKFSYDDKWFKIYYEGRIEIESVEPELKGSRIVINGIPSFIAMESERNK